MGRIHQEQLAEEFQCVAKCGGIGSVLLREEIEFE